MKEYLIDTGDFNIIVRPSRRQFLILDQTAEAASVLQQFLHGEEVVYECLRPLWFRYSACEAWTDFADAKSTLNGDLLEEKLIDMFVLKKWNYGGIVAVRDEDTHSVRVFKRDKLRVD